MTSSGYIQGVSQTGQGLTTSAITSGADNITGTNAQQLGQQSADNVNDLSRSSTEDSSSKVNAQMAATTAVQDMNFDQDVNQMENKETSRCGDAFKAVT